MEMEALNGINSSAYLVISLDIELNLLARQSADPVVIVRSVPAHLRDPTYLINMAYQWAPVERGDESFEVDSCDGN